MTESFKHASAYFDEGAVVGNDTSTWHFCHVVSGAVIGARCSLGQNVVAMSGTRLGDNVKAQNNLSIYGGVEIEDDVFCEPAMVFANVVNPRSNVSRKHEYRRALVRRGERLPDSGTGTCAACGTLFERTADGIRPVAAAAGANA